jgi:uncharacterized protein YbjT (DUF2867 family)
LQIQGAIVPTRTAVLLGASGLIGGYCLRDLLAEQAYSRVILLLRRELPLGEVEMRAAKVEQRVMDLGGLMSSDFSAVNDVFCALGTTIAKAGSQPAFRAVDYELPMQAARAAKAAGVEQFLLVSSTGASPASGNFYLRTKGELERDLTTLKFSALHIFRPGLLLGQRQEFRLSEALAQRIGPLLNPVMIGRMRRYRSVRARCVADAMVAAATKGRSGTFTYHYDEIVDLARTQ